MAPLPVEGLFAHTWSAERLITAPLITPARHLTYPRHVPGEEETLARGALELLVRPASGGSFLATCSLGFSDPRLPTGIWSCPAPDWLCAVAGGYVYLIDTLDPSSSHHLALRPVVEVRAIAQDTPSPEGIAPRPLRLLLFAGFHSITAWGEAGLLWHTARLSWEGLTLGEVQDSHLHGLGWEMRSDRELPFTVDLRTGQHTGGGYLRP